MSRRSTQVDRADIMSVLNAAPCATAMTNELSIEFLVQHRKDRSR